MVTTVAPSTSAFCSVPTQHLRHAAARAPSFVRNGWKQSSRREVKLDLLAPIWRSRRGCKNAPLFLSGEVALPRAWKNMASNIVVQLVADRDHEHHNVRARIHYYRY